MNARIDFFDLVLIANRKLLAKKCILVGWFKCYTLPLCNMASQRLCALILGIMIFAMIPYTVQAENSGGVLASSSTVSYFPTSPVEGGQVTIRLTLENQNNAEAENVEYQFWWGSVGQDGELMKAATVSIPAGETVDVEAIRSSLTAGSHQIGIVFKYTTEQMFFKTINVAGLPDLEVTDILTSPESVNSGDEIDISVEVSNTGSENAGGSEVKIDFGGDFEVVELPAIDSGESAWANVTMTAPSSGDHDIIATVDLNDNVTEADEDNQFSSLFTVDSRMDLSHIGDIEVTVDENSLLGPWIFSGTISRTGGSGDTTVPMRLEILDDNQNPLPTDIFDVIISGGANAQQSWTYQIDYVDLSNIQPGNHQVTAVIDPFQSGAFVQETTDNDRISTYIEKYEVPDVSIDQNAIPSKTVLKSGESITWRVVIINSGQIDVKGKLLYTWDGQQYDEGPSALIQIAPGDSVVWERTLDPNQQGAHNASFLAEWFPVDGYYDANPLNSYASGEVRYDEQLRLVWSRASMVLVDADGNNATLPLEAGERYTISISSVSQETGSVNYSCEDELGIQFESIPVSVDTSAQFVKINCTFTASAPYTNLFIIPDDSVVSDVISWNWDTKEDSANIADAAGDMSLGTVGLIGLIALVLIVVLVAAVILTRDNDEEVDRDIFDYCPACDGELEGTEDRCPSCTFNLKKARKQFHDCDTCGESIPDLLANCPYCGTDQDVSKYFERRERRVIVREEIALPEEEEEFDPESIHATGYEDFDEAIKEFGYESDDLEGDWDDSIAKAEAEVEAAYDRRIAREESDELDDEEAMSVYTTTLKTIEETFESHDIDAILKDKNIQTHDVEDADDLSASDAEIRARLYEITGEEGVMPGDEVMIGMGIQDRSLAGNELPEDAMDFSFEDDDQIDPVKAATESNTRRRNLRRRTKEKEVQTAECGACGTDIPVDASECSTCGAKFE